MLFCDDPSFAVGWGRLLERAVAPIYGSLFEYEYKPSCRTEYARRVCLPSKIERKLKVNSLLCDVDLAFVLRDRAHGACRGQPADVLFVSHSLKSIFQC